MPSISDSLPLRVTTEQIEAVLSGILANRQPRHRAHELAGSNLIAGLRETMALVDG
ncbi:MAG: hypothetical protein H8K05_18715 [Nitrospira sp.]|nr:hypothetical protein [Nitrospira sp.]